MARLLEPAFHALELTEEIRADSVGGAVIETLGHIPVPGEKVRFGEHWITVLEADRTHFLRVLVEPSDQAEAGSAD